MVRRDDVWLRALYDSQWSSMVRLATLLLGSSTAAEEVVQDAMVAAHRRRGQFVTQRHAHAYLRTAVVNRTRLAQRQHAVETTGGSIATGQDAIILRTLDALPPRQREVLVLSLWAQVGEAEVAETLGISRSAVASHARRGTQAVRAALQEASRG